MHARALVHGHYLTRFCSPSVIQRLQSIVFVSAYTKMSSRIGILLLVLALVSRLQHKGICEIFHRLRLYVWCNDSALSVSYICAVSADLVCYTEMQSCKSGNVTIIRGELSAAVKECCVSNGGKSYRTYSREGCTSCVGKFQVCACYLNFKISVIVTCIAETGI